MCEEEPQQRQRSESYQRICSVIEGVSLREKQIITNKTCSESQRCKDLVILKLCSYPRYYFLSLHAFTGDQTHDLGVASTMLCSTEDYAGLDLFNIYK